MNKKIKTGVFSGSFNPIHQGHLILAHYMAEFCNLDEMWFVVTPHNPLKQSDDLLNDQTRLEMTRLAVEGYDKLKVSDVEFSMPKPSYTIDTLEKLSRDYPDREFVLIIGADNWLLFDQWRHYEDLIRNYKILVYPRLGFSVEIEDKYKKSVSMVNAPVIELSSTFVRESIRNGKCVKAFLPEETYLYIKKHRLYQ